MARQNKKTYELSDAEQRDLIGLIQQGKAQARGKGIGLTPKYIPAEVFDKRAVDKGQVVFHDISFVEATPRYDKKNKFTLAIELTDFSVYYTQGAAEAAIAAMKEGKSEVICEAGQLYKVSKDKVGIVTKDRLTKRWTDWVDYWAVDFDYSRREIIKVAVGTGIGGVASLPGLEPPQGELTMPQFEERWTGGYIFENDWQSFRTRQNRDLELTTAQHSYDPRRPLYRSGEGDRYFRQRYDDPRAGECRLSAWGRNGGRRWRFPALMEHRDCRDHTITQSSLARERGPCVWPPGSRAIGFTHRYLGKNCSSCAGLTRVSTRSRSRKLFDIGVCGAAWIRGSLSASSGRPLARPVGPRMTNLEPRSEICECRRVTGESFYDAAGALSISCAACGFNVTPNARSTFNTVSNSG
jgi:site-specific DNA-methyltransferase (adenine-specific)/adenine-specific DNA-methyltransferase